MAEIRIPERHQYGLSLLQKLPSDVMDRLVSGFEGMQAPGTAGEDIAKVVGDTISKEDLEQIVQSVLAIHQVRAYGREPIDSFSRELSDTMTELSDEKLRLNPDQRAGFSERVKRLLTVGSLQAFSKAYELMTEQRLLFHDARILTDLRPVFHDENVTKGPVGFVVVHSLRIEYHSPLGHDEIYLAMDDLDLSELLEVIMRAQDKAESLKLLLKDKSLSDLTP